MRYLILGATLPSTLAAGFTCGAHWINLSCKRSRRAHKADRRIQMKTLAAKAIFDAARELLIEAKTLDEVTVRKIALRVGTSHTAINYHFGSRDRLIRSVMEKTYLKFNAERLTRLQSACFRAKSGNPNVADILDAFLEPSVRWASDPSTGFGIFRHFDLVSKLSSDREVSDPNLFEVNVHRQFIDALCKAAPWFSKEETGWRLFSILGMRHLAIHDPDRGQMLVGDLFDLREPDALLAHLVESGEALFARPRTVPVRRLSVKAPRAV
ncbi:TetR/AcrR family transcriptional regulator [Sulfitobacter sp. 20_GPM-1509m]|uniref:TetR/AcrR family transcriptional regulator n=1 Tax=Sulfitobacter sp. 20_GPM-1509m TaxID=1380367 RepID=UPI0018CC5C0C|nr:TetR family transcriptional regulator [Sulfitobacter sp. 20_GPM-1509m]